MVVGKIGLITSVDPRTGGDVSRHCPTEFFHCHLYEMLRRIRTFYSRIRCAYLILFTVDPDYRAAKTQENGTACVRVYVRMVVCAYMCVVKVKSSLVLGI